MLAVLLDAVAVLREQASGVCPHDRESVEATVHWFLVKDDVWPLSFATVCEALGLDVAECIAALRFELAELGAPGLLKPPRPRVVPLTLVHSVPSDKPARSIRHRCPRGQRTTPAPDVGCRRRRWVRRIASPNPPSRHGTGGQATGAAVFGWAVNLSTRSFADAGFRRRVRAPRRRAPELAAGPRPDPATSRSGCRASSASRPAP